MDRSISRTKTKRTPEKELDDLVDWDVPLSLFRPEEGPDLYDLRKSDGLRSYLRDNRVRLLSTKWIVRTYPRQPELLVRRCQDLPEEAFFQGKHPERESIYVMSYPWHSRGHPDPTGALAGALAKYLEAQGGGEKDQPLFWDHKSLPMHRIDPRWSGKPWETTPDSSPVSPESRPRIQFPKAFLEPRSPEEERRFERAQLNLHMLYHDGSVQLLVFPELPSSARNPQPYRERGWPLFELAGALWTAPPEVVGLDGKWIYKDYDINRLLGPRAIPTTPEDFEELLANRSFTFEQDRGLCARLYSHAFGQQSAVIAQLRVQAGLQKDELPRLLGALPRFERLAEIWLRPEAAGNFDDEAVVELWETLAPALVALPRRPLEVWGVGRLTPPEQAQRMLEDAGIVVDFT